jgi:hypothetical protein
MPFSCKGRNNGWLTYLPNSDPTSDLDVESVHLKTLALIPGEITRLDYYGYAAIVTFQLQKVYGNQQFAYKKLNHFYCSSQSAALCAAHFH